jgi:hypothetical protein
MYTLSQINLNNKDNDINQQKVLTESKEENKNEQNKLIV